MVQQRFSKTHQWASKDESQQVKVGISHHAQEALGDIVYVELPENGKQVQAGEVIGVIESVKTASEIQAPVTGTLVACNRQLDDDPEVLNEAPLTTWIYQLEVEPAGFEKEWDALLSSEDYQQFLDN